MTIIGKMICCGAILFLLLGALVSEISARRRCRPARSMWAELMSECGAWEEE